MSDNPTIQSQGELRDLDPATLLVDGNIRSDAALDKGLVDNIRDHGVLVPIVATEPAQKAVRVRYGQRRTLAAVQAGVGLVPVYVTNDHSADEANRIVRQWVENEHRTNLSVSDRISAIEQLAAFGLSSAQIGRKLRTRRVNALQALTTTKSDLARGAAQRYEFLPLDQAATVAEFDHDPETAKAHVAAAKDGGFDHVAQQASDDRQRQLQHERLLRELSERAMVVVDARGYDDRNIKPLQVLSSGPGEKPLTVKTHAEWPGAVVWISSDWRGVREVHACRNWHHHGHHDPGNQPRTGGADERPAESGARLVIENNRAWRAAETVRRQYLSTVCSRRTLPRGAAIFVATELVHGYHAHRRAMERPDLFASVLGESSADRSALAGSLGQVTEDCAQMVSLACVLAAIEQSTSVETWSHSCGRSVSAVPRGHGLRTVADRKAGRRSEPPEQTPGGIATSPGQGPDRPQWSGSSSSPRIRADSYSTTPSQEPDLGTLRRPDSSTQSVHTSGTEDARYANTAFPPP